MAGTVLQKHSEFMFEEPKIVIGRVGQYCGSVHKTAPKSWITDNALYVSKYLRKIDIIFLEYILKFANLNQYVGRAAQPLVSGSRIYPVETIYPPIDLQRKFSNSIKQIQTQKNFLTQQLTQQNQLFQSLQQQAFNDTL